LRSPADFAGLKIRVLGPLAVPLIEALKASAVPIEFGDLYTALTSGLVDVQDNSLSIFRLIRLQEVHRFILLSGLSDTGEIYLLDFAAVLVRGKTPVEKLGHALGGLMVVLTLSGP
jgi:TRAP-type C4-dicarboxylate transport system substrate-binding protein